MCSIQECVYQLLSSQWLRKTFPDVVFAKSSLPEKRCRICLSEEKILELPEESTNVFKRNMLDRYTDCPKASLDGDKHALLEFFAMQNF